MTDRPIIFSAPMVKALLDGRKSQTRRILKPQPDTSKVSPPFHPEPRGGRAWVFMARDDFPGYCYATADFRVPYSPGDRLWVREAHLRRAAWHIEQPGGPIWYLADGEPKRGDWQTRTRPSIHMPRWASRLTLIVTDVRVQRLQEISEEDAVAEGLIKLPATGRYVVAKGDQYFDRAAFDPRTTFAWLWEGINGEGSWERNPWVVALTFTVHHANIDAMERAAA